MIAGTIAVVLAGWFFVLRFDALYNNVVWNTDANVHLPLAQSSRHFLNAAHLLWGPIFLACLAASLVVWRGFPGWRAVSAGLRVWPWELLLAAVMPAGFLMMRGAGLNPFVSMPSAFGMGAVLLALPGMWEHVGRIRGLLAVGAILAGRDYSAFMGYEIHSAREGAPCEIAAIERALRLSKPTHRNGGDPRLAIRRSALATSCRRTCKTS